MNYRNGRSICLSPFVTYVSYRTNRKPRNLRGFFYAQSLMLDQVSLQATSGLHAIHRVGGSGDAESAVTTNVAEICVVKMR